MNSQWIKAIDKEHFRCPICGGWYQPWAMSKGQVSASKVISITAFGEATLTGNCEAIDNYARQVGIPSIFTRMAMEEKAKWKLDEVKYPPSQWRHLEQNGVYGAVLDLKTPFKTFDDFNELVVLMGHALAVGRKLAQ